MAQDPSVSADAESPLFPSLSDQEHPSLTRGYLFPETCYNITQTYSTIGPLSGESGTKDVKNLPDKYMCMCINKTAEEGTLFKHKNAPILTVKSEICVGHALSKWKLDHNWKVYESRDTVCVCPLTTERDGNYTAQKNGKTCKFKKSRYLAELTCKVQSCSHEFCGWCPIYPSLLESPMPRVKRSSWKELKLLNCMGDNVVRTESKTVTTPRVVTTPGIVTTPRVLPNAITMVPTRPGKLPTLSMSSHIPECPQLSPNVPECPGQLFHAQLGRGIGEPQPSTLQLLPKSLCWECPGSSQRCQGWDKEWWPQTQPQGTIPV
ncbi:uncharacterized protein LOC141725681 isoform X2 [Zonotrichia albicollis]|uniref:uncharacterized protein LOC141725681 isoform X2 n=1 Tax=Zonotrichia albicollis TaxID=44394 RepID=UPI003D80E82E